MVQNQIEKITGRQNVSKSSKFIEISAQNSHIFLKIKFFTAQDNISGFIDRSQYRNETGPNGDNFMLRQKEQWTCETGVLPGHQDRVVSNLKEPI